MGMEHLRFGTAPVVQPQRLEQKNMAMEQWNMEKIWAWKSLAKHLQMVMFMAMFNCQSTMNYKAVFVGGCGSKVKNYPTTHQAADGMGNPDAMAPSDLDLKIGSKLPQKTVAHHISASFSA